MRKKILIAAAIVAALLAAAGIALVFLLDVERYRPDIEKAIAASTGRAATVGRLHLKLFPVTELQADGFTIGEDPRFGTEPFLKADRLFVRVDLWPLLSRHLRVDALTIDAPRIRLVSDAEGRWAYASLMEGRRQGGAASAPGGAPGRESGGPAPGGGSPAASGAASGFSFSVRNLRITRGAVTVAEAHQPRAGDPSREVKEIDLRVDDLSAGAIGGFDLSFLLPGASSQRARLTGKSLSVSADRAEIGRFGVSLGRSSLSGSCSISRFARPILDLRLASPLVDLDEILSFFPSSSTRAAIRDADDVPVIVFARQEGASSSSTQSAGTSGPSLLRDMTMRGDLSVEKIKVMNLTLSAARAKLMMEKGQARLSGISVNLYRGALTGDLAAGVMEAGPPFTLAAKLRGVDFNALASDLSKDLKGLVYGTLDLGLDVDGRGVDTPGLRRNLRGTGTLALRDGKLTSFAALKALAKGLNAAGGRGVGEDETPFNALTGTFEIANGHLRTNDLTLDSPDIDMDAKGRVGLDLSLDLDLAARIAKAVSADMVAKTPNLKYLQTDKGELEVDAHLGGTLMAPAPGIDPKMLERAAKKAAKEGIQKSGKGLLDKLLKKKN